MAGHEWSAYDKLVFPSGHLVIVDSVEGGQVYYRVWEAPADKQACFIDACRMSIEKFSRQVLELGGRLVAVGYDVSPLKQIAAVAQPDAPPLAARAFGMK